MATILLVGGGLLIGSYWKLLNVDLVTILPALTFQVTLPVDRCTPDGETFAEDLVERVRTIRACGRPHTPTRCRW